jgi:superoxide dismutase
VIIDARTMMLHHDKHHAVIVEKLNAALEKFLDSVCAVPPRQRAIVPQHY